MIYFIADFHLYHKNIIEYCSRPFDSVEEQIACIKENWQKTVKDTDQVYILGDIDILKERTWKSRIQACASFVKELNGTKYLVKGNHDELGNNIYRYNFGFKEVYDKPIIINDYIILSHAPIPFMSKNSPFVNIHGHVHNTSHRPECGLVTSNHINVSVEVIDYTPISLDRIVGYIETQQIIDKL